MPSARQDVDGRGIDSPIGGKERPASAVGAGLGWHEHTGPGTAARQNDEDAAELDALVSKLRVYSISDQDDAGPWIRREFPALHYIALPSTAGRRPVLPGDVDRDQRRSVLQECARCGLHDLHRRVGERATSAARGRSGSISFARAAFTKGIRHRSWDSSTTGSRAP